MQAARFRIDSRSLLPLVIAAVAGIWLAADGRLHWDEPSYLYAGVHQSVSQIIAGEVQTSGIPGFSQGRIMHALLVKGVMAAAGSGATGFRILIAINLALTIASLVAISKILDALLPAVGERRVATMLLAMSPVILYMSFKTLGDNEALCAALFATYALLRFAQGGGNYLGLVAAAGLAIAALSKSQMVFLPAAFWAAFCVVPIAGIDRQRLVAFGSIYGLGGFLLTVAILELLGVGLAGFISSYLHPLESTVPFVAKIVNTSTEYGVLWFLLPVALLSRRRKELLAFGLWFLFATAPFMLVFSSIEGRHLAVNLAAGGGLFALGLEVINQRWTTWQQLSDRRKSAVAATTIVLLMGSNALAIAIMPHRVELGQMRTILDNLDRHFGDAKYALLPARGYTDFHIIRVLWPEVDVRYVDTDAISIRTDRRSRESILNEYLGDRHHESLSELAVIRRPLVFMGYRQTFAMENLHRILSGVSPSLADRLLGSVRSVEHLYAPETRWIWGSRDVLLKPIAQVGHYVAFEVSFRSQDNP